MLTFFEMPFKVRKTGNQYSKILFKEYKPFKNKETALNEFNFSRLLQKFPVNSRFFFQ